MTLVIAEAGENHCGDWNLARRLVDMSKAAGADYVKFQLYDAGRVAADDPERDWFHRVQVPDDVFADLAGYARRVGIAPLATPWDRAKAEVIFANDILEMKIASFHIVDLELLRFVGARARRVFLSTGMATEAEIDAAVAALERVPELYLLHCVSEYPLPLERVNLRAMDTLRRRYGGRARIGYSDHTLGIAACVAAAARGAEVLEKHITTDKQLEGTDHVLSADPGELSELVRQVRAVDTMVGTGERGLTPVEASHRTFLRERFHH